MKQFKYALALALSCLLSATAPAQLRKDLSLPYLVQTPADKAAVHPLLVLMHGYGSNEADLFSLRQVLPPGFILISVQAPMALGDDHYQWFSLGDTERSAAERKQASAKMKAFLRAAVKQYHADPGQVYLSGFSQGAMMCYEVGLTSPELVKGIAPLSGRIFDALRPQVHPSAALSRLRVFIGHGDADNRVPYAGAKAAAAYLEQLGLKPALHTYKGMKHEISAEEVNDLVQWLTAK